MGQNAPSTAPKPMSGASRWMIRRFGAVHTLIYRRGMVRKVGKTQQVLLLTTTGRKSGQPHTVPLGTIPEGDGWVVTGAYGGADVHPNWWLNAVANPNVTVQVNDQVIKARMQEITNPADRERIWNALVASMKNYANYPQKTSRVIGVGLLRPLS